MNHKHHRYLAWWAVLISLLLGSSVVGSADQEPRRTTKFSPYRWHTFYGANAVPLASGIVVAEDGSSLIAGTTLGNWLGDDGAEPLHPYSGFVDFFVLKLDSNGTYQWHTFYGASDEIGSGVDYGMDIAIAEDGSIYIVGYSSDYWSGPGGAEPLHPHSGAEDLVVIKLDSNGAYQWHTFYGDNDWTIAYGVAIGEDGSVYVVGDGYTSWLGDGDTPPMHPFSGGTDIVMMKLDEDGAYQWHTFYGSNQWDYGVDIALHEDSVYITGDSKATWEGDGGISPLHPHSGEYDFLAMKLDRDGLYQWHTFYGSEDYDSGYEGAGIVVNETGGVIITGESYATWEGDGGEEPLHPHSGGLSDIVIFSLTNEGAYQWHTFYGSPGYDHGYDIARAPNGNIYLTGESQGNWLGDNGDEPLHAYSGAFDLVIMKISNAGTYQWHTFYGSDNHDGGLGIATEEDGSIYVSGSSRGSWLGDDDAQPIHSHHGNGWRNITVLKLWDRQGTQTDLISTPNPSTYRQEVTFTATISHTWSITPTGVVTFAQENKILGTNFLNPNGVATYITSTLGIGAHLITAEYGGDETYYGSMSEPLTQTVNKGNTLSDLISYPNPSVYGEGVTFTATVTSAIGITPTGNVTFTQDGFVLGTGNLDGLGQATLALDTLPSGEHLIVAEYGGDDYYYGSLSAPLTHTVNRADTLSSLVSSPNPSVYGESVTFTVTVTSPNGIIPTGMVTLLQGDIILGTGELDGSGIATMVLALLEVGEHAIHAEYEGDDNFLPGSSPAIFQVVEAHVIEEHVYLPVIWR